VPEVKKPRARRKKADVVDDAPAVVEAAEEAPKPKRARKAKVAVVEDAPAALVAEAPEPVVENTPKPKRARTKKAAAETAAAEPSVTTSAPAEEQAADGSPRRGWWQRTFGNEE
jgi:ribonuclease E